MNICREPALVELLGAEHRQALSKGDEGKKAMRKPVSLLQCPWNSQQHWEEERKTGMRSQQIPRSKVASLPNQPNKEQMRDRNSSSREKKKVNVKLLLFSMCLDVETIIQLGSVMPTPTQPLWLSRAGRFPSSHWSCFCKLRLLPSSPLRTLGVLGLY